MIYSKVKTKFQTLDAWYIVGAYVLKEWMETYKRDSDWWSCIEMLQNVIRKDLEQGWNCQRRRHCRCSLPAVLPPKYKT